MLHFKDILRLAGLAIGICLLAACAANAPLPSPQASGAAPVSPDERRTLALLGATGMVGGYLLEEALARGHEVRALARTPAKLAAFSERITIVQGDAREQAVISELLRGSDVVINALGPVKADGDAARFINSAVTERVLREMTEAGISQYLVVSGAAVVMPGDDRNLLGWWIRTLARLGLRETLQDKQAEYALLAQSKVDWTLVRCPLIDPQPFRAAPRAAMETPPAFRLRAGELAKFMIDQIGSDTFSAKGPFLGSR
ncbi:NAD(P)-dependent oxidoreductase [Pseudohalioglobus lutimaris]|uniref:NAD(P)-binding domain-containing protein n=1 Tax=Pseudohalioglobus lutimaris TaxID=1737061 RepID=A0A2N5X884_9GAMM|nr:NAD(P)H-binding protein [Pseudohalioglobus lutimaris]PLW70692.1 hypothetical protein C0039_00735 [Pseudohalioglobus lutimaris]